MDEPHVDFRDVHDVGRDAIVPATDHSGVDVGSFKEKFAKAVHQALRDRIEILTASESHLLGDVGEEFHKSLRDATDLLRIRQDGLAGIHEHEEVVARAGHLQASGPVPLVVPDAEGQADFPHFGVVGAGDSSAIVLQEILQENFWVSPS